MRRVVCVLVATLAAAVSFGGPGSAPAGSAVQGPGRLLAPVLVYRDTAGYVVGQQYVVFFRTAGPFAGRTRIGATVPGRLQVEDSFDNHDGFAGAISVGRPSGKCYWWTLPSTPRLDGKRIGSRVSVTLKLHRRSVQRRSVTLRSTPKGLSSSSWTGTGQVARDLKGIGCKGKATAR